MTLSPVESGKFIAEHAEHIRIEKNGIQVAVDMIWERIDSGDIAQKNMFSKTEIHPQSADDQGIHWVFFADLLNFSFWTGDSEPHYGVTYKGKTYTGYLALCAAINRTLDSGTPLTDPSFFKTVSREDLNGFLMGDEGVPCPMVTERHGLLKDAAETLISRYQGSFKHCILSAKGSAVDLLELIVRDFPAFDDKASFQGSEVRLLKRAQILISDLWSLFEGKGLGAFQDIDALSMFPDYRVPQSLQYFGVLEYSDELKRTLRDSSSLLPNGSPMEVEIRGVSIHAVEEIKAALRASKRYEAKRHAWVNSAVIDYFLWGFRRERAKEMEAFPFHRTRCIYY
eukprot:TRINITY_DN8074_c0_g1_i1.p1 TRINITY_DN8074_c0_g1~~TRINITY_DN8074_c0_g1_i1.p1  ORF type:complete len:340 (+),score=77.06 TRINITY_DN8074_c0_g1_i1:74-1093(+)